ncbi:MAG: HEAT repeat domain-containing protein, partial [Cyclobacteriaceae bacterium]
VTGRYRGKIERDPAELRIKAKDPLLKLLSHRSQPIRIQASQAVGKIEIPEAAPNLLAALKSDRDAEVRKTALQALAQMQASNIDQAIEQALSDADKSVRVAGLEMMEELPIADDLKVTLLTEVIDNQTVEEKQAALLTLGSLPAAASEPALERLLSQYENGNLTPGIQLELTEAIESSNSSALAERLAEIRSGMSDDELAVNYQDCLVGGDPERGRRIVFRNQSAQCTQCHAFDDFGGNAGPRLNGIAAKLSREQLLEALINPSARIAPGYGTVTVETSSGKTISGTLKGENEEELLLKVGSRPDTVIMKSDIVQRTNAPSSMPNMTHFLTKREIRDLVSWLATLKEDHMIGK